MTTNRGKEQRVLNMVTGETIKTDGAISLRSTWLWECLNCGKEGAVRIMGKGHYHQACRCGKDEVDFVIS